MPTTAAVPLLKVNMVCQEYVASRLHLAAHLQDDQQLARCVAEANVYALAAHQYWGTWSFLQVGRRGAQALQRLRLAGSSLGTQVVLCTGGCSCVKQLKWMSESNCAPPPFLCPAQAKWSKIDFDYLSYAQLRWSEYHRRKAEFIAAAQAVRC